MLNLKIVKGAELAEGVRAEMRLAEVQAQFTIGRDPGNHWPIPDRTLALSARHCVIVATPDGAVLRDVSTNGTFVNGAATRLLGDHALQDGDRIGIGPYTIVVQGGAARAARAAEMPAVAAMAVVAAAQPAFAIQPSAVASTAPLRGGDPAAMLSGGGPARVGLTEILRNAPPPEASGVPMTKIRIASRPLAAPLVVAPLMVAPVMVAPLMVAPVRVAPQASAPTPPAPITAAATDLLAHLASGLGLPADALAGRDPAQAAAQVGALARAAISVLRQLLEQQAQGRRQIGSRAPALLPVRDVNPLRLAASPEAALLALLAPGADVDAPLRRAATELASHQTRLMAAFRAAASRLGQDMAPASLQAALGAGGMQGSAPQAQLWALYTQLWQGQGLAPGQTWEQGFLEAALLHLAAAYDEPGKA